MANPYARRPFQVTLAAGAGRFGHTVYFLGSSAAVQAAGRAKRTAADSKTLAAFEPGWETKTGGAEPLTLGEFGGLDDFNDEEALLADELEPVGRAAERPAAAGFHLKYSEFSMFPEDSLADVKNKIELATGVPAYRQHLRLGAAGAYRVEGVHQPDIADYGREEGFFLHELAIDRRFAAALQAGEARIQALDELETLAGLGCPPAAKVYDLEEFLGPQRAALAAAAEDAQQSDLLYYGFVAKYWPQLSHAAFLDYLRGGLTPEAHPGLLPEPGALAARYLAERKLLCRAYSQQPKLLKKFGMQFAVTVSTAHVTPAAPVPLTVRNLFDLFATSINVPAVSARFELAELGQRVRAAKFHCSAAVGGHEDAADIRRAAQRNDVSESVTFVVRIAPPPPGMWARGRARLAVVTVRAEGCYSVESRWPESSKLSPADVQARLDSLLAPLLAEVNGFGAAVFPRGGALTPPGEDARLDGLTAAFYWPRALTEDGFRAVKRLWREHEAAGLVRIRGLQQLGIFPMEFRKGVRGRPGGDYSYLASEEAAERWEAAHGGLPLRLQARLGDVRVEVERAREEDLSRIWAYFIAALEEFAAAGTGVLPAGQRTENAGGRLRALQESDPELFDIRRHDAGAAVYSVLCQNPRPPTAYSEADAGTLKAAQRARLTKYWNFTTGEPAYFDCPSRKFPHLSFLEGRHPLGYCLPCCQKTRALPGSRREQVNLSCVEDGEEAPPTAGDSRHLLAYGKRVAAGRRSAAPPALAGLLPSAELIGCRQRSAAGPEGGLFFALAVACGEDFLQKIATEAAREPEGREFGAALLETFGRNGDAPTLLSPGGRLADWRVRLEELVARLYRVRLIVTEDSAGDGRACDAAAGPAALAALRETAGEGFVLVHRVGGRRGGFYPVHAGGFIYGARSEAVEMFATAFGVGRGEMIALRRSPVAVVQCAIRKSEFSVHSRLATERGLVYAVLLQSAKSSGLVYVPLELSPARPDGLPLTFGPRPLDVKFPKALLDRYMQITAGCRGLATVSASRELAFAGRAVGFIHAGHYFFHDAGRAAGASALELPLAPEQICRLAPAASCATGRSARRELLRQNGYRLFVAVFSAAVLAERDTKLRAKIAAASVQEFAALPVGAADRERLDAPAQRAELLDAAGPSFGFDALSLWRLAGAEASARLGEVKTFMRRALDAAPAAKLANVFGAQAPAVSGDAAELLEVAGVSDFATYCELLSAEIGLRPASLLEPAGVLEALEFERRPGESIELSFEATVFGDLA